MLYAHYRELVTAQEAESFWNIYPPSAKEPWLMRVLQKPNKTKRGERGLKAQMERLLKDHDNAGSN